MHFEAEGIYNIVMRSSLQAGRYDGQHIASKGLVTNLTTVDSLRYDLMCSADFFYYDNTFFGLPVI